MTQSRAKMKAHHRTSGGRSHDGTRNYQLWWRCERYSSRQSSCSETLKDEPREQRDPAEVGPRNRMALAEEEGVGSWAGPLAMKET